MRCLLEKKMVSPDTSSLPISEPATYTSSASETSSMDRK
jgi:hypothetical protein